MEINEIARRTHEWIKRMGWDNKTVLESLALIASEVGEQGRKAHARICNRARGYRYSCCRSCSSARHRFICRY